MTAGAAVDGGVLVVFGGPRSPLGQGEGAFDDVALFVQDGVEVRWPPTTGASSLPVGLLIGRVGYDSVHCGVCAAWCGWRARSRPCRNAAGRVRARAPPASGTDQAEHYFERAPVVTLARGDQHRQRTSSPVHSMMEHRQQRQLLHHSTGRDRRPMTAPHY